MQNVNFGTHQQSVRDFSDCNSVANISNMIEDNSTVCYSIEEYSNIYDASGEHPNISNKRQCLEKIPETA